MLPRCRRPKNWAGHTLKHALPMPIENPHRAAVATVRTGESVTPGQPMSNMERPPTRKHTHMMRRGGIQSSSQPASTSARAREAAHGR